MEDCNDFRNSFPFLYFLSSPLLHNREEQKKTTLLVGLGYLNMGFNLQAGRTLLAV